MRLYMVEIRARDWPGTRDWYRDALGLDLVLTDEPNQFVLFRAGESFVAIKGGTARDVARDAFNLAFEVDNVDETRATLIGRGVAVSEPLDSPRQESYREVQLKDPEGTHIRLFSWLKAKV